MGEPIVVPHKRYGTHVFIYNKYIIDAFYEKARKMSNLKCLIYEEQNFKKERAI